VGLRYDAVFGCAPCQQGVLPSQESESWPRFPVHFVRVEDPPGDLFYLPVWRLAIRFEATTANKEQEDAVRRHQDLTVAWVPAYHLLRASHFGDPGVFWTERRMTLEAAEAAPEPGALVGVTRTAAVAAKYAELYVTLVLDKRADVTGMDLSVSVEDVQLWGLPFVQQGSKVVDLGSANEVPSFAVDDLEAIRAYWG